MKVAISADCSTITMKKILWSQTVPAADLGKWVLIYSRLRDRRNKEFAKFYEQDVIDLLAAQERLNVRIKARAGA